MDGVEINMDMERVIQEAYDNGYLRGYAKGKADRPTWIPCSEKLPSKQGQYLVAFPLCNGEPWVYVLSFCKGKFYETDDEWGDVEYDDVTAWMPLPEPYGEREGE